MSLAEIGLQEAPKAPESLNEQLRAFDPRLRVEFNIQKRLWQVQERLRDGVWTHVLFWHDGTWQAPVFRQLPSSADPLIREIQKRDIERHGGNLLEYARSLDAVGAGHRAKMALKNREMMKDTLRKYVTWTRDRMAVVQRKYRIGGRSRTQAIEERTSMLRDLGMLRRDS